MQVSSSRPDRRHRARHERYHPGDRHGNDRRTLTGSDPADGGEDPRRLRRRSRFNGTSGRRAALRHRAARRWTGSVLVSMAVVIGACAAVRGSSPSSPTLIFINDVVEPVAVVSDAARAHLRRQLRHPDRQPLPRRAGRAGRQHQRYVARRSARPKKCSTEFVSSVSHELRTPLTAINGWAETLAADRRRESGADAARPQHHRQGVPPPDHHGRGAAGLLPDAGRALHPARGGDRPARRAGGRHLHLPRGLQPGGHRAAHTSARTTCRSYHRRRRAA